MFVSARGDLTFDQAKPELQKAAANQALTDYKAWFDAATKKADVTVDPQWGSWNKKTGTIVAPAGATSSSTSTTKATGLGGSLNLGGSALHDHQHALADRVDRGLGDPPHRGGGPRSG